MKIKKYVLIVTCVGIAVCGLGLFIGYQMFSPPDKGGASPNPATRSAVQTSPPPSESAAAIAPTPTPDPIRIRPETKIIYEYYYQGDEKIESSTENPPYFLLNMTQEKLQEQFFDWKVIEFSESRVVLRKTMPGSSAKRYILGVKDQYVAVYSESASGIVTLKEITGMPVESLSPEEQKKLNEGIKVIGDDKLAKVLEDYGS
ncbi:MAG: BofC C-terminal domain-containing protein [Clostridiales bacterium]|jgi:hypothetical protein|nr:BofC C-terminal domain-containing protein [Clostridiales bacterium]